MGSKGYVQSKLQKRELVNHGVGVRRFVWDYQGSRTKLVVLSVLLVLLGIAVCLFPVWPYFMKRGAQLVSMTVLIVMLSVMALRWLLFGCGWMVGYNVWVFPNLFDDDSSMFSPVYSVERAAKGQAWLRISAVVGLLALGYYVYTQPSEFDRFVGAQRSFISELYSGALIGDVNQADKDFVRSTGIDLDAEVHEDVVNDVIVDAVTNAAVDDVDGSGEDSGDGALPGDEDGDGIDEAALLEELRAEMNRDL